MAAPMQGHLPDLNVIKQLSRNELVNILESVHGAKDLFIDPELMKPIDRLAGVDLLKKHGVHKIYKLEPMNVIQGSRQRIYITRPEVSNVRMIVNQVNADKGTSEFKHRVYKVAFVPRPLFICEKILEEEGLAEVVCVDSFPMDLLPIDSDVLTMELNTFYKSYFLELDETPLRSVAGALSTLQQMYGAIPNVYAVGVAAKFSWEMSQMLIGYQGDLSGLKSEIGHAVILDRDVDLVTPLCSQVTYEGLLDDIFGIQCGAVEFGKDVTGADKSIKMLLNSQDEIYEEIRNKHFSTVSTYLSARAKSLQTGYNKRHDIESVSQMKDFVSKDLRILKGQHKSLTIHISACEAIMKKKTMGGDLEEQLCTEHGLLEGTDMSENLKYIEDCINKQSNRVNVLRLMCLYSLVKDGLPSESYNSLKTMFLQSHGYHYMLTFHSLMKLGLFTERAPSQPTTVKLPGSSGSGLTITTSKLNIPKKSSFQILSKKLQLIPKGIEEFNLKAPTDMAYVFSGAYTPLSCKLIEMLSETTNLSAVFDAGKETQRVSFLAERKLCVDAVHAAASGILQRRGFGGLEDSIKLVSDTYYQNTKAQSVKGGKAGVLQGNADPVSRTVLVCFLGGVTYSEIAALRFLGYLKGYKFLVMTTDIISGNRFIRKLMEA